MLKTIKDSKSKKTDYKHLADELIFELINFYKIIEIIQNEREKNMKALEDLMKFTEK